MKKTVYFISDAHLGISLKKYDQREQCLFSFFNEIKEKASHLIIVGDLFDFWIEYTHAIRPVYFPVLHELKKLIDAGVEVHYLAGNHDFALGPFLHDALGVVLHSREMTTTLQGKRLYIHHGDGVIPSQRGYRFWRTLLRSPLNQRVYKWLHPNWGIPLANFFSKSSRFFRFSKMTDQRRREYRAEAKKILDTGYDMVLFAHTHNAELCYLEGKVFCNTGEWLRRYTYATLDEGALTLWEYFPGKPAQQIEPIS